MDFIAQINATLDTSQAKSSFESFKDSIEKDIIKLKLDVDFAGSNSSFLKTISKQFESVGQDASQAFAKGFNISKSPGVKEFTNYKKALQEQASDIADIMESSYSVNKRDSAKWSNQYVNQNQKAYLKQLENEKKVAQQVSKIQDTISARTYDAKINSLESKFKNYSSDSAQYEQVTTSLKEVEQAYKNLKTAKDAYDIDNSRDNYNALIKANENLVSSIKRTENEMKILNNEQSDILSPNTIATSKKSFASYIANNSKAVKAYRDEIAELERQLESMSTVADKAAFDTNFKNLQTKAIAEGNTGKSFFEEVGKSIKYIGQFANIYGMIQRIPEVISNMSQEVIAVNSAITELRKVSDASDLQLDSYFEHATDSAKKYGSAISDVVNSAADWKRLGYSLEDSSTLADVTTLLETVGDNMTQESASSGLISTLKGFQKDADEALSIVDKVNEVANRQPIDTSGIFEGLERSASSMSAANNSLEQTISLITAANSVVQDADSVGTAFKTISMRIRGATTDLEEAGLDTEGMAESTASLRKEILALSGVDIMLNDTTFKSTYDILDELATKWQDLTDIQQASITELIAGKRQGNIVSALMQNFDIARDTLNIALNESEGSAEKELSNYQKSIQYSLDVLKATFQDFSTTAINSDVFKTFVDAGSGALNLLTQFIDKFGTFKTLIATIGGGWLSKNGLGKRNAALYKIKQNYRRFINVEKSIASNMDKPYSFNY